MASSARARFSLGFIDNLSIGKKLSVGFGFVLLILVLLSLFILFRLSTQATLQNRIVEQRMPANIAGHDLVNGINASLAALRGYMILGDDSFRQQRQQAWQEIEHHLTVLTRLSAQWDSQQDKDSLAELKGVMGEYQSAQERVENIAHTDDERPATRLLQQQAAPLAARVVSAINRLINEEKYLEASDARKELFGWLSDSRGSFSLSLDAIKSYLIDGDPEAIELFNKRWRINGKRLARIEDSMELLSDEQKTLFAEYVSARNEFEPLPQQMFDIRGSEKWNMANYLLASEAAPLADQALTILDTLVKSQSGLVDGDLEALQSGAANIRAIAIAATLVALVIGILIARIITRKITGSFKEAIELSRQIADGDLSGRIVIQSRDETGELLTSLQQMQLQLTRVIEQDIQSLVDRAREGDLTHRIKLDDKSGFYEKLSRGINELVDVNERVIDDTVRMFGALASGDLSKRIETHYSGAFDRLKQDANRTAEKLTEVIEGDIQSLVDASLSGDLGHRIDMSDKQGFFGAMSAGINQLVESVDRLFKDVGSSMQRMSQGDLTQPIRNDYPGQFGAIKSNINDTMHKLEETVASLMASSGVISSTARQITDGNNNLSMRTEQQASALEQTASSMEELTSTVKNNADNAHQADQLSASAKAHALNGGEIMHQASAAMAEINRSSQKIAEIIGVIDEIAFQTNLLALNASVEAARAGEQGRGFAVVATEVRNLAGRSATAAREIKELINDSVGKVQNGVELIEKSGQSQQDIVDSITRVGSIVAEIAVASKEQSEGIEQVNSAVTKVDDMTQQNAALAEETKKTAVLLNTQAAEMDHLMGFFNVNQSVHSSTRRPVVSASVLRRSPSDQSTVKASSPLKPSASAGTGKAVARAPVAAVVSDDSDWEEF